MLLKVLNGFSQAAIITLALVLITTITTKHSSNVALEDFQKQVEERFQVDNKNYDAKIKVVEDSLNRYQQLRENRAQVYAKRLDDLYELYKKDPTPIENATPNAATVVASVLPHREETVIDKNLSYFESKSNKLDEKVDSMDNRLSSRLTVLEQRVEVLQNDKKGGTRVINTNVNNNSFGGVTTAR